MSDNTFIKEIDGSYSPIYMNCSYFPKGHVVSYSLRIINIISLRDMISLNIFKRHSFLLQAELAISFSLHTVNNLSYSILSLLIESKVREINDIEIR